MTPRRGLVVIAAVLVAMVVADVIVLKSRLGGIDGSPPGGTSGATTWLLIGSDERVGVPAGEIDRFGTSGDVAGARADIILAVRIGDDGTASALSVPRDMALARTDAPPERLATLLDAGPVVIADALCQSLGLGVDEVAMIGFDGLRRLVDLVGGIDIESDVRLVDWSAGIGLDEGSNHLDGAQAIAYVRARHIEVWNGTGWEIDPARNAARGDRAGDVFEQLGSKLVDGVANPWTAQRRAWVASGAVSTTGAGVSDARRFVESAPSLNGAEIPTLDSVERANPQAPLSLLMPTLATFEQVAEFQGGSLPPACDERLMRPLAEADAAAAAQGSGGDAAAGLPPSTAAPSTAAPSTAAPVPDETVAEPAA